MSIENLLESAGAVIAAGLNALPPDERETVSNALECGWSIKLRIAAEPAAVSIVLLSADRTGAVVVAQMPIAPPLH